MTDTMVVQIGLEAMLTATKLAAPMLLTALSVGILIGLLQSVTQVQEATLTFVPKFIGIGVVLLLAGTWMLAQLTGFTHELFNLLPELLRS